MQKYYDILYVKLRENGYLFDKSKNILWRKDFQKYYDTYAWSQELIAAIKEEYNYNITNILLVNSKKMFLLAKNYGINKEDVDLKSGIYFLVLGCLIDYLLDEGTAIQKKHAIMKLSWNYCNEYFEKGISAKESDSIDYLFQLIGNRFQTIKIIDFDCYELLIRLLKQAIYSEIGVIDSEIEVTENLIKSKSILFVMIATILSLHDKEHGESIELLAYSMGECFAIIDDLCDFVEDAERGQKNIVYEKYFHGSISFEKIIQEQLDNLTIILNQIKKTVSSDIYVLILAEIQEWGMSNQHIRERVWANNG